MTDWICIKSFLFMTVDCEEAFQLILTRIVVCGYSPLLLGGSDWTWQETAVSTGQIKIQQSQFAYIIAPPTGLPVLLPEALFFFLAALKKNLDFSLLSIACWSWGFLGKPLLLSLLYGKKMVHQLLPVFSTKLLCAHQWVIWIKRSWWSFFTPHCPY